jgi:RHS repeat-associated protein
VRRLAEGVTNDVVNLAVSTSDRDRICRIDFGAPTTGPCNVVYDGSGNIIEQPTPNGTRVHEFYPSGAVQRIEQDNVTASFSYDGSGEMFALDVAGLFLSDARRDRRYGLIERREADVNGAIQSIIVRNIPGPNGIIASRRGAADGRWVFPFGEQRGTRVATDGESFVQDVDYLPFGKATSTGATPGQPEYTNYQWNGGDALADLGLVHLGARLYDPTLGRFLSRDPLILPGSGSSTNPYAFALNDPVNFSDPSGLCPESPTGWCPQPLTPLLPPFGGRDSNSGVAELVPGRKLLPTTHDPVPSWDGTATGALAGPNDSIEWAMRNRTPVSADRVFKVIGGGIAFGAGALLCGAGGIGCVIGGPMMVFGADAAGSGVSGGPSAATYYGGPILQSIEDVFVFSGNILAMAPSSVLGTIGPASAGARVGGSTGPFRFAHGTSAESAESVTQGLRADAAIANTRGGTALTPGSFFAHEVGPPSAPGPGLQLAYEWGLRHSRNPVIVVGVLPGRVAQVLMRRNLLRILPVPGMPGVEQLVFLPGSYGIVNNSVRWQVVRP